jgi:hypothetical protein
VGKGCADRFKVKTNRSARWLEYTNKHDYVAEIYKSSLSNAEALALERSLICSLPNLINQNVSSAVKLTKDEYVKHFKYNPESPSCLDRIAGTWTGTHEKGTLGATGHLYHYKRLDSYYWKVKFQNQSLFAHRIIWTLFHGEIPENHVIDHVDGDSTNNKIENLRCVTQDVNARNKGKNKNNTSGLTGIFFFIEKALSGYRVICNLRGKKVSKRFYIHKHGLIPALAMAIAWRKQKLQELNQQGAGYTNRHGT